MNTKKILVCLLLVLSIVGSWSQINEGLSVKVIKKNDLDAIERFRSYLQIKSVHPKVDYEPAIIFLKKQCERIGLECNIFEFVKGRKHIVMKWTGRNEKLTGILLNSHIDVVPVNPEKWNHDPFEAYWDQETQNIYARGAQDMKCVGMQYLEAIDRLKNDQKFTPERNVYVSFVPEEEVGGHDGGMDDLVKSEHFTAMNIGFGLDEGLASPDDVFQVYYGERVALWGMIEATGAVGHGSAFIQNTATEKISHVIDRVFEFRRSQEQELKLDPKKRSGDVVSINLVSLIIISDHFLDCYESGSY
jgi:aminoacylase